MKIEMTRTSLLLAASILAVAGLVVFQLTWMRYSRQLSDEIFNQRACMALCSTVENYGGGALCTQNGCSATCRSEADSATDFAVPADLANDSNFHSELRRALDFYQINLDYQMTLSEQHSQPKAMQCAVALPADGGNDTAYINLNFPGKETFVLGKMNFMVLATVLILLFTAVVLLLANWSLRKQKRLLQTNVDFFNNMAHEFRTPLTNVGLAMNMLTKKHQDLKDSPLVGVMQRENEKLQAQVERVLHLASLENGDYALQKERLHLRSLLQSVRDEMAMQIEERGAVVRLVAVPDKLEIFGDRLHLGNVFRNLLDNALKYGGEYPNIQLGAQEQPKGIVISVQDNGIGIASAQSRLIFQKFQRASQGDVHEQKGFGLGLAYVKSMVELHKGFVKVSSEPNRGSRFDVFLPTTSHSA